MTQDQFTQLSYVGGVHCDCCKLEPKDNKKKLLGCARCRKAFYCSKECQTEQWKKENGHRVHCRAEGEFKPGDYVQLARLKGRTELNDKVVRLVGPDPKDEGRYLIRKEGWVAGDGTLSIAAGNLNQLRPFGAI